MTYLSKREYRFGKNRHFPTLYIKGKMAKNVSYNGYKMAQNAPNELTFAPDMYFYEFYQISEDF